jgi:hypothetical protein
VKSAFNGSSGRHKTHLHDLFPVIEALSHVTALELLAVLILLGPRGSDGYLRRNVILGIPSSGLLGRQALGKDGSRSGYNQSVGPVFWRDWVRPGSMSRSRDGPSLVCELRRTRSKSLADEARLLAAMISFFKSQTEMPVPSTGIVCGSRHALNL